MPRLHARIRAWQSKVVSGLGMKVADAPGGDCSPATADGWSSMELLHPSQHSGQNAVKCNAVPKTQAAPAMDTVRRRAGMLLRSPAAFIAACPDKGRRPDGRVKAATSDCALT
jgi:hypothetical protein